MTAHRANIALSNAYVDGRRFGDVVFTVLDVDSKQVRIEWLEWLTMRELVVSYPKSGRVEYAVAKTHGVNIVVHPQ